MRLLFLTVLLWTSVVKSQDTLYSFFVAGHVYGKPGANNIGVHPPFKDKFNYITQNNNIELGILTGDIAAPNPIEQDWIEIDNDMTQLGVPVKYAVGNHDMLDRELYETRYGRTYYSFSKEEDLFIILDPNIDSWNISGEQLEFLDSCIDNITIDTRNIFVFMHQVLWKEAGTDFNYIKFNSNSGRAETINFWTEVAPKFYELDQETIFFAGDVGVSWASSATYDKIENLTFITSGMGGHPEDNFLITHVLENNEISFEIVCLNNENQNCIPDLTARAKAIALPIDLTYTDEGIVENNFSIYPNTASDLIFLTGGNFIEGNISFYSYDGKLISSKNIYSESINISDLPEGTYIAQIVSRNEIHRTIITVKR